MMTVRDMLHALEQMPEWEVVYILVDDRSHRPAEAVVENINIGGVVIR